MTWYGVIRRRHLATALAAVLLAVLGLTAAWAVRPSAVATATTARRLPVYCTEQSDKVLAVSFDAAWGAEDTGTLIDILAAEEVPATFFVVGNWVDKNPDAVRALHAAGHEVMNHSDTHPHMTNLTRQQMIDEITACNDKIAAVTGVRPTLLRPPFGDYNNTLIEVLDELGMTGVQWDVDSLDWKNLDAAAITRRVTEKAGPGSIVLFHNAAKHTPEALPGILQTLKAQGYRFVRVSDLLLDGPTVIDHQGRQHPAASSSPAGSE